jgi:hypothetical protein
LQNRVADQDRGEVNSSSRADDLARGERLPHQRRLAIRLRQALALQRQVHRGVESVPEASIAAARAPDAIPTLKSLKALSAVPGDRPHLVVYLVA